MVAIPIVLDQLDLKIVDALCTDGRLSNAELAEVVASSPSQCSRRRQRLEDEKIIVRYRAQIDGAALGYQLAVFTLVSLSPHSTTARAQFADIVADSRGIQSCHSVTGAYDYILRIAVHDLVELKDLVHRILEEMGPGTKVQSMVVLDHVKDAISIL